jgi:hypothetical protein
MVGQKSIYKKDETKNRKTKIQKSLTLFFVSSIGSFYTFMFFYSLTYKVSIKERTYVHISRDLWNCPALQFYCIELGRAVKAIKSDVNSQMSKYEILASVVSSTFRCFALF